MKESIITAELIENLTPLNRGEIVKLSDQSTIGIPDIAIIGGKATVWVEAKYEDYIKPHAFNIRKLLGWAGPQFRFMAKSDFHGSGSFYIIFFHQPRLRLWHTMIFTGVQAANYCNENFDLFLEIPNPHVHRGKAFGKLWEQILQRRKDNASFL